MSDEGKDRLNRLVDDWVAFDQNETTRNTILNLRDNGNHEELEKCMLNRIAFGTAGLRAVCGAGFSLMNDLIIIQTSQGLSEYVLANVEDALKRGIVIGHDHRHHSAHWSLLVANVFASRGFTVFLLDGLVHTPLVPFSVSRLRASCGVMITASHNSKEYNGFKVYWENAVQIIPPHDEGISLAIQENLKPKTWSTNKNSPLFVDKTKQLNREYIEHFSYLLKPFRPIDPVEGFRLVNTSMHGVGYRVLDEAFREHGLPELIHVEEQRDPDPDFPTVPFPNPEENGALDLAMRFADQSGIAYIMAQDPDADRFGAAQKINNQWHIFTGDELGAIFAERILSGYRASPGSVKHLAMVSSTVSSRILQAMARKANFRYQDCLTGFKYIGNTAIDLEKQSNLNVAFGYEEAIGFMFGNTIRDKDGIAAAMMFATIANSLQKKSDTVYDYLQRIYEQYGFYKTMNGYFICADPEIKTEIFNRLRGSENNGYLHTILAGLSIIVIQDLTRGYDSSAEDHKPELPPSDGEMIIFIAESKGKDVSLRLTLRASGTEPKIKYYLEGCGKSMEVLRELLVKAVQELADDWVEARKHGLFRSK